MVHRDELRGDFVTTPNPLIVMEGGMVRIDDSGNIRSGEGCCCDPGCVSLDDCNLTVTLLYGEPLDIDYGPANDYYGPGCVLAFEVADIPFESGGDISAAITIGRDEFGDPVVVDSVLTHSEECEDPEVDCVDISITLDCNPLP